MFQTRLISKVASTGVIAATVLCLVLQAAVPAGWYLAGSKPAEYEAGVDAAAQFNDHASAYLKSKNPTIDGFGTLMQDFSAKNYAGRRIRFSANVRAEQVQSWSGLWMRVDKQSDSVAFDNMHDRPISGTMGWHNYAVVLNVPQDATGIAFGVLLNGTGTVWINSVNVESVSPEIPTTGSGSATRPDEPRNLNFSEQ